MLVVVKRNSNQSHTAYVYLSQRVLIHGRSSMPRGLPWSLGHEDGDDEHPKDMQPKAREDVTRITGVPPGSGETNLSLQPLHSGTGAHLGVTENKKGISVYMLESLDKLPYMQAHNHSVISEVSAAIKRNRLSSHHSHNFSA